VIRICPERTTATRKSRTNPRPIPKRGRRAPKTTRKRTEEVEMAKKISEAMTSNPCAIDTEKPVAYAAKMMRDEDVGFAPIVEGDRLVGTVTDRDIAVKVVAEGKDPETTKVREIASTDLVTVQPDQDLDEALRLMAQHQVRRLPVVEEDSRLVGVVAQADVAQQAEPEKTGRMVEEISE
jgi:CBS domain-containing protein